MHSMPHYGGRFAPLLVVLLASAASVTFHAQSQTAFDRGRQSGSPATITGELTAVVGDDFARGRTELMHFIRDARTGRSFRIHLDREPPAHWRSGSVVTVSGQASGTELFVLAASTDPNGPASTGTETSASTAAQMSGDQTTLVIVANFRDLNVTCSVPAIHDLMFTSPIDRSVDDVYRETSSGKTSFSGTVVGPYTLDAASTDPCDHMGWADAATAAAAVSVDVNAYRRKVYVMPANSCPAAGIADFGVVPSRAWVFTCSLPDVYAHELGHNLGMHHAATPEGEYRDVSDFMGQSGGITRQVNAPHKAQMGWLPDTQAPTVTQNGFYDVAPLELDPATSAAPQALRIFKPDTNEYYYLSYRVGVGFDASLACCEYLDRLSVHRWSGAGRTMLLALLEDGESFNDPASGLSVTQVTHNAAFTTVDIRLGASCVAAAPSVSVAPANQIGAPGDARTYDVSVVNNDTPGCPTGTFSLAGLVPAGWMSALSATTVQLRPGTGGWAALTVTPPSNATAGTHVIEARATDTITAVHTGADSGSYAVCRHTAPTVTVSPATQTGLPGTRLTYAIALTNTDGQTCGSSTFSLAPSVPLGWSAALSTHALMVAPGATGTISYDVTSSAAAPVGSRTVSISLSDTLSAAHAGSANATYLVGDAVPPTAPSGLVVSTTRRDASLSWRAATDNLAVAGYRVWRNGANIATTTGTSWVDSSVVQGSSYTYVVTAYDAAGNRSPDSNSVTVTLGTNAKRK